jgi:ribosomal-protein-alanine N-acetyltransferase
MPFLNDHNIFQEFPVIALNKVNLRELKKSDTKDFYDYITHDKVKKYLSDQEIPKDLLGAEEEVKYWANLFVHMRSIYWGIATKNENKLIGTAGFNNWNRVHGRAEISYDLNYNYWNQGIMTEVVIGITKFAFEILGVNRCQATVVIDNIGSIKVLEKAGYVCEGKLRNYNILHGEIVDSFMYSIIK